MRIYVDSSALLKRAVEEPESAALVEYLQQAYNDGAYLGSSLISRVEVPRALQARSARGLLPDGYDIAKASRISLSGVSMLRFTSTIADKAATIGDDLLRSLDAIHLASTLSGNFDVLVAYDTRLCTAAQNSGIPVVSPN